jgi:hypothetical protein
VTDENLALHAHAFADERVALDLAARPDLDTPLHLDERADARMVADPAAVQVRERVHDDSIAELDVLNQAVRRIVAGSVGHS